VWSYALQEADNVEDLVQRRIQIPTDIQLEGCRVQGVRCRV